MRIHHVIIASLLLASLAGCSGSSSGSGGITTTPIGSDQLLGSRSVPGGTITVSRDAPVQPGTANVFHLTCSAEMPAPTAMRAWIGIAYDPMAEGILATPSAHTTGTYDVSLVVPSPLTAGSHVWVRLTFADGSVIETGSEDFLLADQ